MNGTAVFRHVSRTVTNVVSAEGAIEIGTGETQRSTNVVVQGVIRMLNATGYPELRQIEVIDDEGALILRGTVTSYYLKQLAQSRVSQVKGVIRLCNELEVISPAAGRRDQFEPRAMVGSDRVSSGGNRETRDADDLMQREALFESERVAAMTDAEMSELTPHELVKLIVFAHPRRFARSSTALRS